MKTNFMELFRKTQHTVEKYRKDFIIDAKIIKANPGVPYIHITRKTGTTIIMIQTLKQIESELEELKVPKTEIEEQASKSLIWKSQIVHHYIKERYSVMIHFFDGAKLRKINGDKAIQIVEEANAKAARKMELRSQKNKSLIS